MEFNGLTVQGFDWDQHNSLKIQEKHGILPQQVEFLFAGVFQVVPDEAHSNNEARYAAYGLDPDKRPMIVSFTLRTVDGAMLIRPISARRMHAKERERHDQDQA